MPTSVGELGRRFIEETVDYWRDWVRRLAIPFEWQGAVIRAAITLQLNAYDDTGAIIAAMTTSIPEAAQSSRNWDYRYCWLRDGYFVVDALNRLGATETMERYLGYIVEHRRRRRHGAAAARLPDQRRSGARRVRSCRALPGYRGMGPVRIGNDAYRQVQHDVYGSAILAATHVFFDERLVQPRRRARCSSGSKRSASARSPAFDQPDAGLWELRGKPRVHTFSSVMCWAACDRLARIATRLGIADRAPRVARATPTAIARFIDERCWSDRRQSFVEHRGRRPARREPAAARRARLPRAADDPRFAATVRAIERELKRGDFVFRYVERDDFGEPENAFLVCTFWYVNALAAHRPPRRGARAVRAAARVPQPRTGCSPSTSIPRTGEHWGNFPQTYSMVGLITSAIRLSLPWDEAVLTRARRAGRRRFIGFPRRPPRSSPRRASRAPARPTRRLSRRR